MTPLKKMPLDLKNKIRQYSKNGIDISSIIDGYSLKGEDLSGCVIKNIKRIDEDMSGVNLANAKIGNEEKKTVYFIRCDMRNSNFDSINFVSSTWIRSCDIRNCNFRSANLANVDYRNSDIRQSTFCDTILRIGTSEGIGCKFDENFFDALTKGWDVKIQVTSTKGVSPK
jgi:uncharacterized protein YjbI with pentapeptide repeats